ncbi:thioesterase family protein [Streptomyces sp. NBC_00390]|uniref:acyl-CoA thioesterase n=1 Tax=Streptomyces sp. NBC_00390 TaxID=2975736 RepID=UPI002E2436BA
MGIPVLDVGKTVDGVDPSWWSWDGAHGGYSAALALTAARDHLVALGEEPRPVRTLITHFLTPVDQRPLHFATHTPRAGRRAAVSTFTGRQGGEAALTGTALFGQGGAGPAYSAWPTPPVPGPEGCGPIGLPQELAPFARHLEIRPATGARPLGGGERAELVAWIRFADGRQLDAEAVVILTDALPPALFAVWTSPRPVPTAELTVHFTDALDAGPVDGWALVRMRTEHAGSGWAIDDSTVWSGDGRLLALAQQARIIQPTVRDGAEEGRHA